MGEGHLQGHSQPSSSSSLPRRKSSSKRPLVYSDQEDEDVDHHARVPISQKTKRARTADSDESPSRAVSPVDPDMEVDIDSYHEPSVSTADDSRFLPEDTQSDVPVPDASPAHSPSHKGKAAATNKRRKFASAPTKKKLSNDETPPPATDPSLVDSSQSAKDATGQPLPKKRKLPTIKKNKAAAAPGTSTPSVPTQRPPPPPPLPPQDLPKPSVPVSEQRKQALTGVRDIDLGDSKIYAELFKGTGGITPRSGLKKDEERRKELDRMRDEARARRAEEAKFIFDLQSQADKIARFEQRLRAENSTVLHPNFLAAKFRDEWELERRHKRRDGRGTPKEEGEA